MIDYVSGIIKNSLDKKVTIDVNGFGMSLQTPRTNGLQKDKPATLFSYLHWSAEQGPTLFGFQTELERTVFLLIIDCPKIGPSLALSILAHFSASQFLEIITSQDDRRLSEVSGIGAKKAEQIMVQLKHKVQKLVSSGQVTATEAQSNFVQWQNVNDVLASLNYSKAEITKAMTHLTEKYNNENCSLDQLIRTALSYLSGTP